MKNTLIIFDFYGVIGGEISPRWFRNHFDEAKASILKDKYFVPADKGIFTIEETLENMANDLGFSYDEILTEFKSYVTLNTELLSYITKLRKNNNVALLSNAAKGIYELFFPDLNLNDYFDKVFLSFKEKLIKPDFKFYELCVKSFKRDFDKVIMIDDNINNVKDLDKINIEGIQYKNNQELFNKLDKYL